MSNVKVLTTRKFTKNLKDYMRPLEEDYLNKLIKETGFNISKMSRIARVNRGTMYKKLRDHNLLDTEV